MSWFSCIPRKHKRTENEKVILEKVLLRLCEISMPMIYAGVISFSNGFAIDRGWEYKISSIYEDNIIVLNISIKNEIETFINENDEEDDCVVCTNSTNQTIKCCNQPICLDCLKEIKHRADKKTMSFCCPMCRRDLDNSETTYSFDTCFLDKIKQAGKNEQEKINLFKNMLASS